MAKRRKKALLWYPVLIEGFIAGFVCERDPAYTTWLLGVPTWGGRC